MLKQTLKLTLYDKNPYSIKGKDGKTYAGILYEGFAADGSTHRFTSQKDEFPVFDTGRYQEEHARDFKLFGKTKFGGGTKWSTEEPERKSLNKDFTDEGDNMPLE